MTTTSAATAAVASSFLFPRTTTKRATLLVFASSNSTCHHNNNRIRCSSVAIKHDESPTSTTIEQDEEIYKAKVGARVRVKVPLKVFHVPKVPEIDLTGMEGNLKQYVGLWKGKRISANYPYKIEFVTEIEGRGSVKFFAHLREDEFEYIQD